MSETFFDEVVKGALGLARETVNDAIKLYPRRPGLRRLSEREQLEQYLSMTPEEMQQLIKKKGRIQTEYYIASMEKLRSKYLGDAYGISI